MDDRKVLLTVPCGEICSFDTEVTAGDEFVSVSFDGAFGLDSVVFTRDEAVELARAILAHYGEV